MTRPGGMCHENTYVGLCPPAAGESMGEVDRSVLRVGGLAGVLAGVFVVLGLITFVLASSPPPGDFEQTLATFPEDRILVTVAIDLFLVSSLLFLAFLAALYGSLKEPSRVFARLGLGSGVIALVLLIVALGGFLFANDAFSGLYEAAAASDRPVVVATFGAVSSLLQAGNSAGFLFAGLAFVAFGLAMRGSRDFGEGLAWLSVVLGIIIVLLILLVLGLVGVIAVAVFALVFGWKVYSRSRAA